MDMRFTQTDDGTDKSPLPPVETCDTCLGNAAEFYKTIGNKERLSLLWHLARGETSVSELEKEFNVRQPTMSQRLAVLREAGLVATRRQGKTIYYRIASDEALRCIHLANEMFCNSEAAD